MNSTKKTTKNKNLSPEVELASPDTNRSALLKIGIGSS